MKEHYVSYECAQALKRLGFKEEVSHYYCHFKSNGEVKLWSTNPPDNHNARLSTNEVCSAPRLDQAAAWLRSKGYSVEPFTEAIEPEDKEYTYQIEVKTEKPYTKFSEHNFDTYEEALSDGISKALELLGKEDKQ